MSDSTIHDLPAATSVTATDVVPIDQGLVTRKATMMQVSAAVGPINVGVGIHGANAKTTPADPDELGIVDTADGNTLKKLTWANLKATLLTYFSALTGTWNISTTGNAGSATKLQTARNLDVTSFDGTADVTIVAPAVHAASSKATPVDADEIGIWDSVTGILNKLTWANLKTTLSSTFTTIASLAASGGAALIGFIQSGTGAIARTVQSKLQDMVSIKDFGAVGDGITDDTAAFLLAHAVSKHLYIPAGRYKLNAYRPVNGECWHTDGPDSVTIVQANVTNPAIHVLSDVASGQLSNLNLSGFTIDASALGAGTVAAVIVEATAPYIVKNSNFDFYATNTKKALEIVCPNNEIFTNKFKVHSEVTSTTAFITKGAYNSYELFAVYCADGTAINDSSINSTFLKSVTDGQQIYGGHNCTIINPTVETIYGTAVYAALEFIGHDHTVINPTLTNVAAAKITNYGMAVYNRQTIINPRIWGTNYPVYPFDISSSSDSNFIGGDVLCVFKLEQYLSASVLAKLTLVGDVSTFSVRNTPKYQQPSFVLNQATYTVDANKYIFGLDYAIGNTRAGGLIVTLPSGAEYSGRELYFWTRTNDAIDSVSANVVPMTGAAGTAIVAATAGKWAKLQYDGTNWIIISNN